MSSFLKIWFSESTVQFFGKNPRFSVKVIEDLRNHGTEIWRTRSWLKTSKALVNSELSYPKQKMVEWNTYIHNYAWVTCGGFRIQ